MEGDITIKKDEPRDSKPTYKVRPKSLFPKGLFSKRLLVDMEVEFKNRDELKRKLNSLGIMVYGIEE